MSQSVSTQAGPIDPDQTVYTTRPKNRTRKHGDGKVFHLNKDCQHLSKGEDVRRNPRHHLRNGWRVCRTCSGEAPETGENRTLPCPRCGRPCQNMPLHIRRCDG